MIQEVPLQGGLYACHEGRGGQGDPGGVPGYRCEDGKCWCVRALGHPARLEDGTTVGAVEKEFGGRGQGG